MRSTRSRSAIARLGAREDGTDTTYFSILSAEWPEVRAGLQARLR